MLVTAILIAATWDRAEDETNEIQGRENRHIAFQQLFPLLYPGLIMLLLGPVAHYSPGMAAAIGISSFIFFSSRLLMTQSRLRTW